LGKGFRTEASCFAYLDERIVVKVVWKMKIFHRFHIKNRNVTFARPAEYLFQTGFGEELRRDFRDRAMIHIHGGV
jgi:hypothetical protein